MKNKQRIFLCGMMGSGKTTVGKILAGKLDQPFTDLDEVIEKKEGMPIPEIFELKGETYFREAERNAMYQTISAGSGVVALGGGALQNQQIIEHLKINGLLIFLKAPRSVLLERLKKDSGRPLLQHTDDTTIRIKIDKLLEERIPLYNRSHITIHTERMNPEEISESIIRKMKAYEG